MYANDYHEHTYIKTMRGKSGQEQKRVDGLKCYNIVESTFSFMHPGYDESKT